LYGIGGFSTSTDGEVFRVAADGTKTVLHEFDVPSIGPGAGRLVEGVDGNFYGFAMGGTSADPRFCAPGLIFKISPMGDFSVFHTLAAFDPANGSFPEGYVGYGENVCTVPVFWSSYGLVRGADGHLYGALPGGQFGQGVFFKLTMAGEFTVITHFKIDRLGPTGLRLGNPTGLTLGSDGHFYGALGVGGALFRVTMAGALTVFDNSDLVIRPPAEGNDGYYYGFTRGVGPCEHFYRLTPAGTYTRILTVRGDGATCPDGYEFSAVTKGADGNFYGVAQGGGLAYGTVVKVSPAGALTVLHFFHGLTDGYYPTSLMTASPGVFFGTTMGNGGSLLFRLTVPPDNRAPVATDDTITALEDTPASGTLKASDADGDALTYRLVTDGTKGSVVITNAATGAFTYTPNANLHGTDTFTFLVNDGTVDSLVATESVTIMPVNDAPVAADGLASVTAGGSVTGTLVAADVDDASVTYVLVTNGTKGTGTITDAATGAYTYTATAGSSGTDTFTFKANDGGLDSNVATETVTITPPCATDISASVAVTISAAPKLNRKTGRYTQNVTLKNNDGATAGPVSLVLDGLSANATLFNATGTTACAALSGRPYINVNVGSDAVFSSRERATVTLDFSNPSGQPVTYTARVLAGAGTR